MVYSPKSDTRTLAYQTAHQLLDKCLPSLRFDLLSRLLEHCSHTLVPVLMHRFKSEIAESISLFRALGHVPPERGEFLSYNSYKVIYKLRFILFCLSVYIHGRNVF